MITYIGTDIRAAQEVKAYRNHGFAQSQRGHVVMLLDQIQIPFQFSQIQMQIQIPCVYIDLTNNVGGGSYGGGQIQMQMISLLWIIRSF